MIDSYSCTMITKKLRKGTKFVYNITLSKLIVIMSAARDYSAHQKSPPGLCCSLSWSPSANLDLNVSDI